ncbi:MAG: hypothetical protein KJ645_12605 [Planctomycetes bacterium]|nr:hypothetical protein [Planctomycetota bacterium]
MSRPTNESKSPKKPPTKLKLVKTKDLRPEGDLGHCLRPLGLCDLGGCCDICWYGSEEYNGKKTE